jgi:hypothetical protein
MRQPIMEDKGISRFYASGALKPGASRANAPFGPASNLSLASRHRRASAKKSMSPGIKGGVFGDIRLPDHGDLGHRGEVLTLPEDPK